MATRKFYWLEDGDGIVVAHGAEAKSLYMQLHRKFRARLGGEPHLMYVLYQDQRPPVGVHGDSWEAPLRW